VSAEHGRGIGRLLDAIGEALGPAEEPTPEAEPDPDTVRVAIVGRPNVGKSSLVNRYLGEDRMLVDDRPGTTRDSIDAVLRRGDRTFVLVDTAGIRRKARIDDAIERASTLRAMRAIERADVVVLLLDSTAPEGVAEQDARLLGLSIERGAGLLVAFNKADLVSGDDKRRLSRLATEALPFAPFVPVVFLSAKTGRGADALLDAIQEVAQARRTRITTGQLNRFFSTVLDTHPPPSDKGRTVRLYYVTQTGVAPPTFVVSTNRPEAVHPSYQRYVINQIREAFGFSGSPIRVHYRSHRKKSRR